MLLVSELNTKSGIWMIIGTIATFKQSHYVVMTRMWPLLFHLLPFGKIVRGGERRRATKVKAPKSSKVPTVLFRWSTKIPTHPGWLQKQLFHLHWMLLPLPPLALVPESFGEAGKEHPQTFPNISDSCLRNKLVRLSLCYRNLLANC